MNIFDKSLSAVKISLEKEKFESLLFEPLDKRPDFENSEKDIKIPVFIAKLNNKSQNFVAKIRERYRLNTDKIIMYSGFHILKKEPSNTSSVSPTIISEDGEVDVMRFGQLAEIKKIKPEKRQLLCQAINKIVSNKSEIELLKNLSAFEIFSFAILENDKILNMFSEYDYSQTPLKCIIVDSSNSVLNACSLVRLLLMHLLAFDIVVASYKGHSSIEDCLPEHYYDVYEYADIPNDYKVTKEKKSFIPILLWGLFAALIAYVVLHWGLSII